MASRLLRIALLLAPVAIADGPANPTDILTCCNSLKIKFGDKVAFDSDPRYPALDQRYVQNAAEHPTCIFLPTTSDDVAAGLSILITDSKNLNSTCPFAIKSGGLGMGPGANDISNGITFDLSWINSTTVSDDRATVRLGSGATWAKVAQDLDGTGLAVPGGEPPSGVGGMVIYGGLSWFMPRTGLLSDNIVNIEVVLASGIVQNVNTTHDADLFLALMGGGNNFGIVTYVDVKPFEQSGIWGGTVKYPLSATDNALSAFNQFVNDSHQDSGSNVLLEFTFASASGDEGDIMTLMLDADSDLAEHPALNPLLDVQPQLASQLEETSLCQFYSESYPSVNRSLMSTITIKNDPTVLAFVHDYTNSMIKDVEHDGIRYVVSYEALSTSFVHNENVLGLNYTTGDFIVMVFNPYWNDPELDFLMYVVAEKWKVAMDEYLNTSDSGFPFEYAGYAAPFQSPLSSYSARGLQFLKDVAKEYDPDEVFQKFVPGGFKLSAAK